MDRISYIKDIVRAGKYRLTTHAYGKMLFLQRENCKRESATFT